MNFAATRQSLLAPDANVPHRDALLDSKLIGHRLSIEFRRCGMPAIDECELARVKYRFDSSLRVLYDLRCAEQTVKVATRTFKAKRLAEIRAQKRLNATADLYSLPDFLDEELGTAFWVFPNDRKISNLSVLSSIPANLNIPGYIWTTSRVVAYAPEKCATAECIGENEEVVAYAKVFSGDAGRKIVGIYEYLHEMYVLLPRVIRYSEFHRTLLLEAVKGTRLADLEASSATIYRKLGSSIARLHQVRPHADFPRFNRLETNEMRSSLQTIMNVRPDVAVQAANLLEKISAYSISDEPGVCLHGDVHPKNAIWNDGALTLIDLDQVSTGPAAADIGSFLAGLQYRVCVGQMSPEHRADIAKNFLAGYAEIRPLPSGESLRRHTAAALFAERALRAITRVRLEGLENMSRILTAGENILMGEGL